MGFKLCVHKFSFVAVLLVSERLAVSHQGTRLRHPRSTPACWGPALQQKDEDTSPATSMARKESKEQRQEGTTATGPPAPTPPAPPRGKQSREKQGKARLQTSVSPLHCLLLAFGATLQPQGSFSWLLPKQEPRAAP